jgi:hypothetical protein
MLCGRVGFWLLALPCRTGLPTPSTRSSTLSPIYATIPTIQRVFFKKNLHLAALDIYVCLDICIYAPYRTDRVLLSTVPFSQMTWSGS